MEAQQAFNPYLPSWEYIPDAEPRVFGDRVYIYGSHDRFNGPIFCMNDYVCWSAPVSDLSSWRYEGVIYRKNQDPKNPLGLRLLFAPDVVQGTDGRYYLYYAFDLYGMIGVAVCDTPAGQYRFYGWVSYPDGTIWGRRRGDQFPFDPGVLVDDDGRVYLYSGFYRSCPAVASGFHRLRNDGGVVVELQPDMKTIRTEPRLLFPKQGPGSFAGHEFFEASSIRKDGDRYLFVYSSRHNHELCYAVSDRPDGDFVFGGTLVDLGDLFLDRQQETHAANYLGNTHGGLLCLKGQWYIFYHRHTNRHGYSRQACAEKLVRRPDGSFQQAEVTSCGLNPGPLRGQGSYEARIACNLWSGQGTGRYDGPHPRWTFRAHPYFTQTGGDRNGNGDQYIANMRDGATAGFKYFEFDQAGEIQVELGGRGEGTLRVYDDKTLTHLAAELAVSLRGKPRQFVAPLQVRPGVRPLFFQYRGSGAIHFYRFTLTGKDQNPVSQ